VALVASAVLKSEHSSISAQMLTLWAETSKGGALCKDTATARKGTLVIGISSVDARKVESL
jgi:hypothetical protein